MSDENDNTPLFELDEYDFRLFEESGVGTVVGHTLATDADLGEAGEIVYSIKPGPDSDIFAIKKV